VGGQQIWAAIPLGHACPVRHAHPRLRLHSTQTARDCEKEGLEKGRVPRINAQLVPSVPTVIQIFIIVVLVFRIVNPMQSMACLTFGLYHGIQQDEEDDFTKIYNVKWSIFDSREMINYQISQAHTLTRSTEFIKKPENSIRTDTRYLKNTYLLCKISDI
jgi:hypothetical protein